MGSGIGSPPCTHRLYIYFTYNYILKENPMSCTAQTNLPLLGDRLPEFTALTTHGTMTLPNDYAGSWFVLYSHPADFTPVCTTEFSSFQDYAKSFEELNCKLIGLSIDQVFAHIKWVEWIKDNLNIEITFPVIAGTEDIAKKLGMLHPGKGLNTVRVVFIVDPQGVVRLMVYYPQEIGRNMEEILRSVKALQVSDTQECAVPANWPNNALLGDRVIVAPATTTEEAAKRLDTYEGYDWWFCHKPLA